MPPCRFVAIAVVCGGLLMGGAGCDHSPRRVSIEGKVTYKSVPIADGSINFSPKDTAKGSMEGAAIVDGKYAFAPGRGLIPGEYRVSISMTQSEGPKPAPGEAPGAPRRSKELLPEEYNTQTKLEIVVPANGKKEFDFDLK